MKLTVQIIWIDDDVGVVLDQQAKLDLFYRAKILYFEKFVY
jgi:hypothetical protein